MTWVAWRQYRLELIMVVALLAILAAFLVPTGIHQLALFEDSGLAACLSAGTRGCSGVASDFIESSGWLNHIVQWFIFAPAIIGLLLAAPIVMEFEQGTYRLAWTQSVTRGRWLAVKLGLALLGTVVFALVLTLVASWWFAPQDRVQHPFATSFYLKGVMPLVYTIFALTVALAAGVLSRRTIVAVVVTTVGFFVALLLVGDGLRPNYLAPVERIEPISAGSLSSEYWSPFRRDRSWFISGNIVGPTGNVVGEAELQAMCGNVGKNVIPCLESLGLTHRVRFHPADRFWTFQAIEAALLLGASAPLLGLTVWLVRRRMP